MKIRIELLDCFAKPFWLRLSALVLAVSCVPAQEKGQPDIADIQHAPVMTEADKQYADVFKPLDGMWRGTFHVLRDKRGQTKGQSQPHGISIRRIEKLPLATELAISVEQHYESESPFFQHVIIKDRYPTAKGDTNTVVSTGVNKVQDGKLWCVVVKPDETVIHRGSLDGPHTIIWQRTLQKPLKIEYFRETVLPDAYTIIGWGYYGDDDPALSPRLWFKAEYKRVAVR